MTLGGWLAGGIAWHISAMWALFAVGIAYLLYGFASGHFLGSDAYRLIGAKLDKLRAEYDAGREMAFRTDYPNSGPPIL